jgi:hypothetical protein
MRSRVALAAVLAALLAVAPGIALPGLAATTGPTADPAGPAALAAAPKIVIVVGTVEAKTSFYRGQADEIYAEAIKWTPNVVKVYSPNATWANVRAAAQGATIFVYIGHGYGFPSPYRPVLSPAVHDGMGLNETAGAGDSNKKYYGESFVATEIHLAKNALVILSHLCYAAGGSETGDPEPTPAVAKERIDNFAYGFLRAGARAVIADSWNSSATAAIRGVFSTHQPIGQLWRSLPSRHGHEIGFIPLRSPQFRAAMDPETWTTGYHRSMVGNFDLPTDDIVAGATAGPTDTNAAGLVAPGAAAAILDALPLHEDETLATRTGATVALGTRLRVDEMAAAPTVADGSTAPPAVKVATLDGATQGWVSGDGLSPRDSASPELWHVDGPTAITPNLDGSADRLNLMLRFSESATWTIKVFDPAGAELKSSTGTGYITWVVWDPVIGGEPAPDGAYTWSVHAVDGWGNPALDASGAFTLTHPAVPPTGVLGFAPMTATMTNAATVGYTLTFAAPVTGFAATDLTRTGTAPGCTIGAPLGSGASYRIAVTGCDAGSLGLTLNAASVTDVTTALGPAGPISAAQVTIDRTGPTAVAPKAAVRAGSALTGSSTPATLTWSATAAGAPVASYDLARSYDGGAFVLLASRMANPTAITLLAPGHTYRYEVRARDTAGNLGAWKAGPTLYPRLVQQTSTSVKYAGSWITSSATAFSGGSVRMATAAGASVSYTFSGRSVGFVTTTGPTRGAVKVYVDGILAATVDTYAATWTTRAIVFSRAWSSSATHTLKLVVVGTAGRPRVDLDALAVVR